MGKLTPVEALSLFIYHEANDIHQSPYEKYLSLLPESYDESPITWEDEQLDKLPQNVMISTKRIKKRLIELTNELKLDADMFTWAFCSVFTRSFSAQIDLDNIPEWIARMKGDDGNPIENPEYAINCPL